MLTISAKRFGDVEGSRGRELTSFPLSWIWGAEEEARGKGIGRRGKEGEKGNRGEGKFPLYQHLFFTQQLTRRMRRPICFADIFFVFFSRSPQKYQTTVLGNG